MQNSRMLLFLLCLALAVALIAGGCGGEDEPAVDNGAEAPVEADVEESATEDEEGEEEAAGEDEDDPAGETEEDTDDNLFTLEELAYYDGQDGRPAYIAVEGVVYDVTNVPQWGSGMHFGFEAGKDVTDALGSAAPHGAGQLGGAVVVGELVD